MKNFSKQLIKAALGLFAKLECSDIFVEIQKMSDYIYNHFSSAKKFSLEEAHKYLQEYKAEEFKTYGILSDDIVIAVAILFDKGLVDIDGNVIKVV